MTLVNFVPGFEGEATIPLGPLYIAAVLEQSGCEVDFRDYQLFSHTNLMNQETMMNFFSDSQEVLGISCLFNTLPFILLCLQKIKTQHPEKTIILGGPGPSSVAEKLMRRFPFIDMVVRGEGENTVRDLAKGLPYQNITGIVYRSGKKVVVNPPRRRIDRLDDLPFPAYHEVDFSKYNHAGIITARGCPYSCTFCEVAPLWGHHTERRSVSNVISEIKILHDHYGVNLLHINDDTFVLDREWVLIFCNSLKAEKMDVAWKCLGRIDLMDEDLISRMADANCVGIQYGIESGSERILKLIRKQITTEKAEKVIEMSVGCIDDVISTFMWGFPFETMEDFYETTYFMGVVAGMGSSIKLLFLSPSPLSSLCQKYAHRLAFSEELVSNLLWGVMKEEVPHEEKEQILKMITQDPDIFSGFFYIPTPDIEKKYNALKEGGLI